MTATKRIRAKSGKGRRVAMGISGAQKQALRSSLRSRVCSESWIDAMFAEIRDKKADGTEIVVTVYRASAYPPKADTCPMVICDACAIPYPAYYVGSSGVCVDCQCCRRPSMQSVYGPSSFAAAMEAIRAGNLRLQEARL